MDTQQFARAAHGRLPARVMGPLVRGLILAVAAAAAATSTAADAGSSARVPAARAAAKGPASSIPAGGAAFPGCVAWTGIPPSPTATFAGLTGVAALSPCDAWVVGFQYNQGGPDLTLTEHWNGSSWTVKPAPGSGLSAVAATSSRNAWAVGGAMILHWNGKAWARQAQLAGRSSLTSVAATSAASAWAVGFRISAVTGRSRALIEHWNGRAWKQVPSPRVGLESDLRGVAAASRTNAWAVGAYVSRGGHTLIEHWNGRAWNRVPSPSPGGLSAASSLSGVAVVSRHLAWAVGTHSSLKGGVITDETLILRWNGTAWRRSPSPALPPGPDYMLDGVAATSAASAWAVGFSSSGSIELTQTVVEHWNGRAWKRVRSPGSQPESEADSASLSGVAASSASNIWAVGSTFATFDPARRLPLALHCC